MQRPVAGPVQSGGECFLVTGGAGFIGSHLVRRLLDQGHSVIAVDEFNDYYDPVSKWGNIADILQNPRFTLRHIDIRDIESLRNVFVAQRIDVVIHLAARAGVRPRSLTLNIRYGQRAWYAEPPRTCARVWCLQFRVCVILLGLRWQYRIPVHRDADVDRPISPYAATNEGQRNAGSLLFAAVSLPVSGLRFLRSTAPAAVPIWHSHVH